MLTIEFSDKQFESAYESTVARAYDDAKELLPNLSDSLTVAFKDSGASDQTGVGGFALSPYQLNVAVFKNFSDIPTQKRNLRAVVFHELYHINQGFTYDRAPFTALEAAIYEGCAVKFEREHGGGEAVYADYSQHSEEELSDWRHQLEAVGAKYFEDNETWHKWADYNPELDQKWIIYKVGTWMVERILSNSHLNVLQLQDKGPSEILSLMHE